MPSSQNNAGIDRLRASLALDEPVTKVKQVSPARARALSKLKISTVRDLLQNYPRRYVDMSAVRTIASARVGEQCTIIGTIDSVATKRPRRLVLVEVGIVDATSVIIVTAFNQRWLADQLSKGQTVAIAGKVEFHHGFKRMTNPYIEVLDQQPDAGAGVILPVHPLTGDIKAGMMRRLVKNALELTEGAIDPLPLGLRMKYRLMSRMAALHSMHEPASMDDQRQARRRLAYEELLLLELMLMREGAERSAGKQPFCHVVDGPHVSQFLDAIPFELTDEQQQARIDIMREMASGHAMNHMLLGDVGTGKTIVAGCALAAVADSGSQAALMAPTEILATQHAASLGELFDKAGVQWELLTGSTPNVQREAILERLAAGTVDVLIGTHALLEDDVRFKACSLVVIDEQQRFGVNQRAALLEKGSCPDALYLTATPIPRTLALALFGSLTLSYIHARPKASAPRKTFVHNIHEMGFAYDAVRDAVARGEQAYVVCPLVGEKRHDDAESDADSQPDGENGKNAKRSARAASAFEEEPYIFESIQIEAESDMSGGNAKAAENHADFLQKKILTDARVGVVHGKLSSDEKRQVMDDFREGRIDVLVATTVIEVGVDVPNATVMVIEDADRFGLAQLHQLRGRVGRGDLPGEVHLISGTMNETALERLAAMESTDDGFELAAYDLSLRREGDILGNRQHGASILKLVNVVRDGAMIEAAHADAQAILAEDPNLESAQYAPLAREVRQVFRDASKTVQGG